MIKHKPNKNNSNSSDRHNNKLLQLICVEVPEAIICYQDNNNEKQKKEKEKNKKKKLTLFIVI